MDVIVADVVDYYLDGLRTVGPVKHDRLVEIDVLLGQVLIVNHELQIGKLVFGVNLLQADTQRAFLLKLFRLVDVELVIIVLTAPLRDRYFIWRPASQTCLFSMQLFEITVRSGQIAVPFFNDLALGTEQQLRSWRPEPSVLW